jgi:hypothetical protein
LAAPTAVDAEVLRLDPGVLDHGKFRGLSNAAIVLWIELLGLAIRHHTDGIIDSEILQLTRLRRYRGLVRELQEARLLDDVSCGVDGQRWRIHDYQEWQAPADPVERRKWLERWRGRRRRAASASPSASPSTFDAQTRSQSENGGAETLFSDEGFKGSEETTEGALNGKGLTAKEANNEAIEVLLCNRLANLIESNGSKRPRVTEKWLKAARLLIEREGRDLAEVESLIEWCQADEFWRSVVLSMPKFHQKYDALRLKALRGRATVPGEVKRERRYTHLQNA